MLGVDAPRHIDRGAPAGAVGKGVTDGAAGRCLRAAGGGVLACGAVHIKAAILKDRDDLVAFRRIVAHRQVLPRPHIPLGGGIPGAGVGIEAVGRHAVLLLRCAGRRIPAAAVDSQWAGQQPRHSHRAGDAVCLGIHRAGDLADLRRCVGPCVGGGVDPIARGEIGRLRLPGIAYPGGEARPAPVGYMHDRGQRGGRLDGSRLVGDRDPDCVVWREFAQHPVVGVVDADCQRVRLSAGRELLRRRWRGDSLSGGARAQAPNQQDDERRGQEQNSQGCHLSPSTNVEQRDVLHTLLLFLKSGCCLRSRGTPGSSRLREIYRTTTGR
jgi:hypothetical protein